MKYANPIIRGFNPDPSICRVGQDYYLVTSSFEYFPGIPIYHSVDLVNWTQIGNCIERPEQLPFDTAEPDQGMWAPTIRHHDGRFYVTATFKGYGSFIVSSQSPQSGWSDPVKVDMTGIDPSILFDGGRAYYCTNQRGADNREAISLAEINVQTGELLSEVRQIWHGMSDDRPQYLESPHVYHIGEWYYLLAAEGGTGFEHMITAARSHDIWGPYESCPHPLLTNRHLEDPAVACAGHGDLLEDDRGNWWVVHLATRPDDKWYSHMGRETFLLPVRWDGEWPVIGDGVSHIQCDGPLQRPQELLPAWNADLSIIEPRWLFLRRPEWANYSHCGEGLRLMPSRVKISDRTGSPTFLAVRQPDIDCVVEAKLSFQPLNDGDEAGLTIYLSCVGHYCFCMKCDGGVNSIRVYKNDHEIERVSIPAGDESVTYRILASKRTYVLSCAVNGGDFNRVAEIPVLARRDAGKCFTGTLIGVYAQCDVPTEAVAELKSFETKPLHVPA